MNCWLRVVPTRNCIIRSLPNRGEHQGASPYTLQRNNVSESEMLVSKQKKNPRQLSQEQIMEGLPPVNIGALFMPPVWGAANGIWLAILYYPAWLLADNLFYSVYLDPRPLTVGLSIVAALVLAFATIVFARAGQGYACQRALSMGKTKEQYLKSQKKWAVAMVLVAVIMIVAATYYNLVIRPTVGA